VRIVRHRLRDHWYERSGDVGRPLEAHRLIVLHYTAMGPGAQARDFMLLSPRQKQARLDAPGPVYASAHVVVDRDGTVWQIVPFDRQARHAGVSRWRGLESVNRCSLGIEIANWGWLDRYADGTFGRPETPRFSADQVVLGPMPGTGEPKGWEPYAQPQLDAVEAVVRALLQAYPTIVDVVGHQDVSPGRKFDPGPAFPMARFRALLESRGHGALPASAGSRPPLLLETTGRLNMRGGPGIAFDRLDGSPLPVGTRLELLEDRGDWLRVRPEGAREGHPCWVSADWVRPCAAPAAAPAADPRV
jgi:N-acetylmuramoyl-L-alanine amidase